MLCENCGANEAVVQLTQVVNHQMTVLHLCQACAREKGVGKAPPLANPPLADFLAQMGQASASPGSLPGMEACGFCGLTFSDFREIGRLGCPHCYTSFEGYLRGLLRRIHGGTQHVGKVYLPPDPTLSERQARLEALGRRLQRAVETEDFERAAEIRDQIRSLEPAV